jgi:tetratricopeptide (TPR) repeat protein
MLSRLTWFLAFAMHLTGCAPVHKLANWAFDYCPSSTNTAHQYFGSPDADDLVIFIHGLCGDAKTTWTNPTTHFVLPEELARDFAKESQPAYVVAFEYTSRLQGGPSILSITDHLQFEISELLKKHPYRTLRIVAHSMGGLVAREYILRRQPHTHPQLKPTHVVLLASPSNGSELAKLGRFIPENRQVEELRHIDKGNTYLESLNNDWNREFKGGGHPRLISLSAGREELGMPWLGVIVPLSSAVLHADESMGFQQDHVSIAKPEERNVLYRWVKAMLEKSLKKIARQRVEGMVQQGWLTAADVPLLEGLEADLAGTEFGKVLTYVKTGQFQAALALLAESEQREGQLVKNIAQRRFTQGEIHELQFQMAQASSYYSQAVQLTPSNASYRNRFGVLLFHMGEVKGAILQYDEAVRLSRTSHNLPIEGHALGNLGAAYTTLGQYAKAIEYLEQALPIYRKVGNIRGEGATLGNLGATYLNLGQYTKAIEYAEQAFALHRKIEDVQGQGHALGNLGVTYTNLGQYAKAIEYFEQTLTIYRKIGDVRGEGTALASLGNTYTNLAQYPKAIEYLEQALMVYRKIGDVRGEGNALANLGSAYTNLGQYAKAIEYSEQALAIHRTIGDVQGQATALANLGSAYDNLGQYAKAIEHSEQALAIHRTIGDMRGEGNALGNLGAAYTNLGQYAKAIEYSEQALAMYRKIEHVRGEGATLGNLGSDHANLGQYAKAVEYFEQALTIHRTIEDVQGEGTALANLGSTYANLGEYAKAIEYFGQALTIHRRIGDLRLEGATLGNLGSLHGNLRQLAKTIEYFEQALAIHRKIGDMRGEGNALGNLGATYGNLGQHAKALEFLNASEVIFEDRLQITFPWKAQLERLKMSLEINPGTPPYP